MRATIGLVLGLTSALGLSGCGGHLHRAGDALVSESAVAQVEALEFEEGFAERELVEAELLAEELTAARAQGIDVIGPLPPDTAFTAVNRAKTDCYVCMYHDQGLIPLKAIAFDTAVNVTLGLPIVRTSVDHGTALDIAWQGKARLTSFLEAVDLAVRLAEKSDTNT